MLSRIKMESFDFCLSRFKRACDQAVFNRLKDLEKLMGGSAEMFWRGARPGYQAVVDSDYNLSTETQAGFQDQVDEFENNLRRIMAMKGMKLESLTTQVSDPTAHVQIQLQMISAVTGIPIRVLTGSERGELASSQDRNSWFELIQERREEDAEIKIVRPFVDRCIEYGILPAPDSGPDAGNEYMVGWADLWSQSEKEKAEIGKIRAESIKAYASVPMNQDILPPETFYDLIMGWNADQIELITQQVEAMEKEEEADFKKVAAEAKAAGLPDPNAPPLSVQPAAPGQRSPAPPQAPVQPVRKGPPTR